LDQSKIFLVKFDAGAPLFYDDNKSYGIGSVATQYIEGPLKVEGFR
jgi:hypothetical protein